MLGNRRPCTFYAQGNCREGANCKYLHEDDMSGGDGYRGGRGGGDRGGRGGNWRGGDNQRGGWGDGGNRGGGGGGNGPRGGFGGGAPRGGGGGGGWNSGPSQGGGGGGGAPRGGHNQTDTSKFQNVLDIKRMDEMNKERKNANIPQLFVKQMVELNGAVLSSIEKHNFVFAFEVGSQKFFERQLYLNPIINGELLRMQTCRLAALDKKEVLLVGFKYMNYFTSKEQWGLLIKRTLDLDNYSHDVIVEISPVARVDLIFMNEKFLIVTAINDSAKQTIYRIMAHEGAPWTGDKEAIATYLNTNKMEQTVDGQTITAIGAQDNMVILGLDNGTFTHIDIGAKSVNQVASIHKPIPGVTNVPIRGVFYIAAAPGSQIPFRFLSVNAAGEIVSWLPNDAKSQHNLNEEVTHTDHIKIPNSSNSILLVATKAGGIHIFKCVEGSAFKVGEICDYLNSKGNMQFNIFASVNLKCLNDKICVLVAKGNGVIGIWTINE